MLMTIQAPAKKKLADTHWLVPEAATNLDHPGSAVIASRLSMAALTPIIPRINKVIAAINTSGLLPVLKNLEISSRHDMNIEFENKITVTRKLFESGNREYDT